MIEKRKKYKLSDFDYPLPKKFIAEHPSDRRDRSKLMVVHKDTGEIEHRHFYNISDYMRKNDLILMNNTKVFPARLLLQKIKRMRELKFFY